MMMECRVLFMTTLPSNVPYQSMEQQTFSEEQLREFREVFSIFDSDKDGAISSSELVKVLKTCGLSPTESQVEILIKHIDTNGNGMIEFTEFVTLMSRWGQQTEEDLRAAFKVFDRDGNGYIDSNELSSILNNMGEHMTEEQVEDMIREADSNGDGLIDYDEFVKMMTATPASTP